MKKQHLAMLLAVVCLPLVFTACSETSAPVDNTPTTVAYAEAPDAGTPIEGSYIVVFRDQSSLNKNMSWDAAKAQTRELAEVVMGEQDIPADRVHHIYSRALVGYSAKISAEQAELLRQDKRVAYVEQDHVVSITRGGPPSSGGPVPETTPWGITRVGGAVNYTGSHKAWILDSGIDLDNADLNVDLANSVNFIDPLVSADDDNGHGTHVAGTVAAIDNDIDVVGVAAGATVVAVKVLDRRGSGSTTGVIAGIDYVAANGTAGDVANMSLSGGAYQALDDAVINASNNGIHFALAAGNDSSDANLYSPARANGPYIYTVSAGDINDNWAYFSNYGNPPVDYNAPGYNIVSLKPGGGTASMSGTSMASPHVCGLLLSTGGNISFDGYINGDPDGNADPIAHR